MAEYNVNETPGDCNCEVVDMLRSVQLLRNCTKLQSTLKGIPTIVRRGVGSDSSLLEVCYFV